MTAVAATGRSLRTLVVDDEALARSRLCTLLSECRQPAAQVLAQAGDAVQAMHCLQHQQLDLVLLDIQMPGADGLQLARVLKTLAQPPALVFVTAHAEHALQGFELDAADYLTKPVRLERLQAALHKVERLLLARGPAGVPPEAAGDSVLIQERNRTERVPLAEVLYFKAEQKYVTVRTASRQFILDTTLGDLEYKYGPQFLRIHRNALVAKKAVRALQKHHDPQEGDCWALRLDGVEELLLVSRRQLPLVRELLGRG